MRKTNTPKILLLFSVLLANTGLWAQSDKEAKTLLWQISGNGLDSPSYLYGTMHTSDKRAFKFNKSVQPSFDACEAFAMEVNPDEADPMAMLDAMKLDSIQLSDLFTTEEYDALSVYFKDELKMNLSNFSGLKPFFVVSMSIQAKYGKEMGQAVDLYFHKMAKEQDKMIYGLETLEEQLNAVNNISLEEQADMLLEVMEDNGKKDDPSELLMKYYSKGDLQKMAAAAESQEYSSDFAEGMITDRNKIMKERLIPLIHQRPTFIAVGALHLPGGLGLLTLLEEAGYTIKPMLK